MTVKTDELTLSFASYLDMQNFESGLIYALKGLCRDCYNADAMTSKETVELLCSIESISTVLYQLNSIRDEWEIELPSEGRLKKTP